jgi:hypothetical protein
MLDTYIKNKGITKTIIHNNNHHNVNEISWDADYDGNMANLNVALNQDGRREKINIQLDNNDLASILNIPSVKGPLEERLERDFIKKQYKTPKIIELYDDDILTHISSPLPQEELIVPLKIVNHRTPKTRKRRRKSKSRRSPKSKRRYTRRFTL